MGYEYFHVYETKASVSIKLEFFPTNTTFCHDAEMNCYHISLENFHLCHAPMVLSYAPFWVVVNAVYDILITLLRRQLEDSTGHKFSFHVETMRIENVWQTLALNLIFMISFGLLI